MADLPPIVPASPYDEGGRATRGGDEGRRRARARGEVTQAEAVPEPPEEGVALKPREAGASSELARAFQANAAALEGLGAMQARMVQALERNDRSEMILASTQTLNETFRHLTTIQRERLARMERGADDTRRASRAVPLLLLGITAVVVFLGYFVIDLLQQSLEKNDPRLYTTAAVETIKEVEQQATAKNEAELQRMKAELAENEDRRRDLERRLDDERAAQAQTQRDLGESRAELDGLRGQMGSAQRQVLTIPTLEGRIRELESEQLTREPRLKRMEEDLEAERRENARLRKKIGSAAIGLPDEEPGAPPFPAPSPAAPTPAGKPTPEPAPTPAPKEPTPATPTPAETAKPPEFEGTRDPRVLNDVRNRLNQMFDAAGNRRPDYWQIMRVDAVASDRLRGVIVHRYDTERRQLESIEAREVLVWVERDARRVMLELRQGERTVGGLRTPLPDGKLQVVLAEGESITQVFAASGLRLIGIR